MSSTSVAPLRLCIDVCPETRADVYEANWPPSERSTPPTRGVPNAPVNDMDVHALRQVCDVTNRAIDLDMDERTSAIQVGAIVLHTGYAVRRRLKGEYATAAT